MTNWASVKSLTWILSDMFRIRRSSLIMPKPVMGSHCKAILPIVLSWGTAMGGTHTASNGFNEAFSACFPPVWLQSRRFPRPRVLIRGSCVIGAALALPDITLCKFWEWLAVIFRIQRSSFFMLKPLMRSHCKVMCYTKLANCFGRGTAMGGTHTASNGFNEAFSACFPPVWLQSRRFPRPRVLIRGSCVIGAALALPDITLCKFWEWLAVIFRIQRSSFFMLKPLRSHCKAMCYRKLAKCFGRGTAMGGIHTASNICNEADSACLPPVWLKCERLQRPREYWLEGSAPVGLP